MATCRNTCDTLRSDDDTGDECVECGRVYPDLARKPPVWVPAPVVVKAPSSPTSRPVRAHQRPGWFHNIQMSGGVRR